MRPITWDRLGDKTVLRFVLKQKWVYVCAMTSFQDVLACRDATGMYGNESFSFDSFRIQISDHEWRVPFMREDWSADECFAMPSPYIKNVRFANQLIFNEAFGSWSEGRNVTLRDWDSISRWAQIACIQKNGCKYYYCGDFEWDHCPLSRKLFDEMYDASAVRAYKCQRSVGRIPLLQVYFSRSRRRASEKRITDRIESNRRRVKLNQLRRKKIEFSGVELLAYANGKTD